MISSEKNTHWYQDRKGENLNQGFGSGSARIRMFLPCPDPDPHKFANPDPGKKVRKLINKSLF